MNAAELAHRLGGKKSGRQWQCVCPAHEDTSPSLIVYDGKTALQVRCLAGCEPLDVIAELHRLGHWEQRDSSRDVSQPEVSRLKSAPKNYHANKNSVSHETMARALFERSTSCAGTVAQQYLESREIWSVARDIDDVRFCALCPRGAEQVPAIVIAMRSFDKLTITAVHRIFLTRGAAKDGKGMLLGTASGAAMQLQRPGSELHICEGFETGLSLIAMDEGPVWSMGSRVLIQTLPVLVGVDHLVIWADNDFPGIKAARQCRDRWLQAGRQVTMWVPKIEGKDAADVWRDRCARP